MSTSVLDDVALGSALAMLWKRHRQENLDLISLLEATSADVLRGEVGNDAVSAAASAAHKLAGSLGTFGFDDGSRSALEAELLLREPQIDARQLAEAVTDLRASVEEVGVTSEVPDTTATGNVTPSTEMTAHVASSDVNLVSRLTVAAAAIGLAVTSSSEPPNDRSFGTGLPPAIIFDDETTRSWDRSAMLSSVATLAPKTSVIVLTDRDSFEDRAALARVGAAGVLPRTQEARQTISFIAETLDRRHPDPSLVLAVNIDGALADTLTRALPVEDYLLHLASDPATFWETLEDQGADLLIVGLEGSAVSGPELCRMVRGHPCWNRLPLIVIGGHGSRHLSEAMTAGADDYVEANVAPHDLRVKVGRRVEGSMLARIRSDTDPLTGSENRQAAERSLDHLLRLATRRDEPLAVVLLAIDGFDRIRETEGNAMGEIVLRHLGSRLLDTFRGDNIVGRWTHNGFAVGIYGASSEEADRRITDVLDLFAAEQFPATSGNLTSFTFSAGIASFPTDGSTLASLERRGETALQRAKSEQNCTVVAGDRSVDDAPGAYDVVVVDDDDSLADVIEHALGLSHYTSFRFNDGAEAAEALGEGRVRARIILLDVGLPSLDGYGILQILRDRGVLEHTRVIMLTARSSEAEMLRGLGLGATEHITKPFSIPVLLGRLDQTRFRSVA